jgi:hypothetical protein
MDDEKLPEPQPSTVIVVNEVEVVGAGFTDHTTPREVTADPPSDVIFPPPFAVLKVIPLMAVVVTVGIVDGALLFFRQRTDIPQFGPSPLAELAELYL